MSRLHFPVLWQKVENKRNRKSVFSWKRHRKPTCQQFRVSIQQNRSLAHQAQIDYFLVLINYPNQNLTIRRSTNEKSTYNHEPRTDR